MTNVEFTSEAIRSAKFKERLRGYPPEEVDAFLERCATALEQLTDRLGEMNARALRAEAALAGNSEADESVRRTLVLAQRTAEMAVREANDEATQIRAAARTEADRIVTDVQAEAHRVESDAAQRAAAIEQDAEQARAAAIEQAAVTINAANVTAEATLRDAAREAAALDSEITDEVTRRRSEIETEIDARRLQALQEIEESVRFLRVERERLSLDVSTLGTRLDAERSHVLEALRSATARLDEAFAHGPSDVTSQDGPALQTSGASLVSVEPVAFGDFAASSPSAEPAEPAPFADPRETFESSEAGETPMTPDAAGGRPLDGLAPGLEDPTPVADGHDDGHADLADVAPSVADVAPSVADVAPSVADGSAGLAGIVAGPVDETVGDATVVDETPEQGSPADLTAVGELGVDEPTDGPSSFGDETTFAAEPVRDERSHGPSSFGDDTTFAAEPVRDETTHGPSSFGEVAVIGTADSDGVVADESAESPHFFHPGGSGGEPAERLGSFADQPADDEPAADAFAAVAPLEAGAESPGDAEAPSLTVVDGWASPEAADDAERRVDDPASDPWAWSPEAGVAAEPATTWFPDAALEDVTPDHDHVSAGDAWGAWSDDPGSPQPGSHDDPRSTPAPDPSDPGAGRSTIFQPTAGWASTADSTPASEPWSVWGSGPGAAHGVGAGSPAAQPPTWKPAWQAEAQSHGPAPAAWESAADPAPSPWLRDDPQSVPEPVGPTSPSQPAVTVSDPGWDSVWQPPEPVGWGSPSGDEAGAWIPSARDPGADREGAAGTDPMVGAGTEARGMAVSATTGPVDALDDAQWVPEGEPAPGDLHDPWRDLPQPGDARSQSDDPPPPRLLFTLEDDGRPAEPGGDSSPDAKPRKSLLGRRRF